MILRKAITAVTAAGLALTPIAAQAATRASVPSNVSTALVAPTMGHRASGTVGSDEELFGLPILISIIGSIFFTVAFLEIVGAIDIIDDDNNDDGGVSRGAI